jgi:hypothetical protein
MTKAHSEPSFWISLHWFRKHSTGLKSISNYETLREIINVVWYMSEICTWDAYNQTQPFPLWKTFPRAEKLFHVLAVWAGSSSLTGWCTFRFLKQQTQFEIHDKAYTFQLLLSKPYRLLAWIYKLEIPCFETNVSGGLVLKQFFTNVDCLVCTERSSWTCPRCFYTLLFVWNIQTAIMKDLHQSIWK